MELAEAKKKKKQISCDYLLIQTCDKKRTVFKENIFLNCQIVNKYTSERELFNETLEVSLIKTKTLEINK